MAIIGMPRRTLVKVAESTIAIEEKMLVRKRIMARYCQDFDSDESNELDDEEQVKPKRKGGNIQFHIYKKCVYCQICYNKGHFTKECKLLIKFCQICKSDNHNIDQCHKKSMSGRCPTREIVLVHVVQVEALVI
jgi:hypothetical protein